MKVTISPISEVTLSAKMRVLQLLASLLTYDNVSSNLPLFYFGVFFFQSSSATAVQPFLKGHFVLETKSLLTLPERQQRYLSAL